MTSSDQRDQKLFSGPFFSAKGDILMTIAELQIGMVLNNQELVETFQCSPQGGMRRSKRTGTLVLTTDCTKLYHDRWKGDVLHYTGMGQTGDQSFSYMQNRTLFESDKNGVTIHLFEVRQPRQYTYCGIFALCDEPYTAEQPDQYGNLRKVCIFPIRKVKH